MLYSFSSSKELSNGILALDFAKGEGGSSYRSSCEATPTSYAQLNRVKFHSPIPPYHVNHSQLVSALKIYHVYLHIPFAFMLTCATGNKQLHKLMEDC